MQTLVTHRARILNESGKPYYGYRKWFEPRNVSCLSSVIVRVRVVFRKTVVGD